MPSIRVCVLGPSQRSAPVLRAPRPADLGTPLPGPLPVFESSSPAWAHGSPAGVLGTLSLRADLQDDENA